MEFQLLITYSLYVLLLFSYSSHGGWFSHKHESALKLKNETVCPLGFDPTRVNRLSWHPRAFTYRGFLTHEKCDHLIQLAKDKLEKSMVADNDFGESVASEVRTSSGMFIDKHKDDIVARIETRIAPGLSFLKRTGRTCRFFDMSLVKYRNLT
ncbi:unnamed protein product [Amaranthus hypochondriacus]